MNKNELVSQTCLVLVQHFRNLVTHNGSGFNSRIFSHVLHPEKEFMFLGTSEKLNIGEKPHPEHVVPCAVLITECCRLIKSNENHSDEYIALLLQKHWKIAHITKDEAKKLDQNHLT